MKKKWFWLCLLALFCFELVMGISNYIQSSQPKQPQPSKVQVVNPMLKVESLEEMEKTLDFNIPTLDKEVESYIVLVIDQYPTTGRIYYKDGSTFSMKFGSGDVSGIYGGELLHQLNIDNTEVSFYQYNDLNYALWEQDGFTYSLTGTDLLESEVTSIIQSK